MGKLKLIIIVIIFAGLLFFNSCFLEENERLIVDRFLNDLQCKELSAVCVLSKDTNNYLSVCQRIEKHEREFKVSYNKLLVADDSFNATELKIPIKWQFRSIRKDKLQNLKRKLQSIFLILDNSELGSIYFPTDVISRGNLEENLYVNSFGEESLINRFQELKPENFFPEDTLIEALQGRIISGMRNLIFVVYDFDKAYEPLLSPAFVDLNSENEKGVNVIVVLADNYSNKDITALRSNFKCGRELLEAPESMKSGFDKLRHHIFNRMFNMVFVIDGQVKLINSRTITSEDEYLEALYEG